MRATCTYEQAWITAHVQCSGASTHQPQPISTTFPLPTPPQPQMTNENAQHMCHDRCFSIFSLLHKQALRGEQLQANCAMLPAQQHSSEMERPQNFRIAYPSPRNAKRPLGTSATVTDAYSKKRLCERRCEETGAAARVGRASGSAAAGGRPAPPCVSAHCCHKGSLTFSTSELAASQSASQWRS